METIQAIKRLVIAILLNKEYTYAEIIIALSELIAELARKSVEEDLP